MLAVAEPVDEFWVKYLKESFEERSSIKNGSEELLCLESYEPLLDTPLELLHTLPLGVGKSLISFLWHDVLTESQKRKLQTELGKYRASKSYSRTFRAKMVHNGVYNGSFIGRDYKILSQILPALLRRLFAVKTDSKPDLTIRCMDAYGLICLLVYMRSIDTNITEYVAMVQDLYLFNDGSFLIPEKRKIAGVDKTVQCRAYPGYGLAAFKTEHPDFKDILFEARENSDNYEYVNVKDIKLVSSVGGFFLTKDRQLSTLGALWKRLSTSASTVISKHT
ncbi:hypothetical protein MBANPS3_010787 [Mucor bainieri]